MTDLVVCASRIFRIPARNGPRSQATVGKMGRVTLWND